MSLGMMRVTALLFKTTVCQLAGVRSFVTLLCGESRTEDEPPMRIWTRVESRPLNVSKAHSIRPAADGKLCRRNTVEM